MKKLAVLPFFLLASCSITAVPVVPKFPDAPETLQEKCAQLKEATEDMSPTEFAKLLVKNTIEYHICARKVDGWNEWYTKQKAISDEATKK